MKRLLRRIREYRSWATATDFAQLCDLNRQHLVGEINYHPWRGQPDTDVPLEVLAALNKVGYLTFDEQPQDDATQWSDGHTYRQRSYVVGWINDPDLINRLKTACTAAGLRIITADTRRWPHRPESITVTERDGETYVLIGPHGLRKWFPGRAANRAAAAATWVSIADPDWDRPDLLWHVLATVTEGATA